MTGVGALGDGAGGNVAGIGTAFGGEVVLVLPTCPVVNCHGVPALTVRLLHCTVHQPVVV